MSNHTVPAAAEGMPTPDFLDLEPIICDLALAAGVAKQFICNKLGRQMPHNEPVRIERHEYELIEFALMEVENRADALRREFYVVVTAPAKETGQ